MQPTVPISMSHLFTNHLQFVFDSFNFNTNVSCFKKNNPFYACEVHVRDMVVVVVFLQNMCI